MNEHNEIQEYNTGTILVPQDGLQNGSIIGGASWIAGSGTLGSALRFNGVDAWVNFGSGFIPNVNTVSFWMNTIDRTEQGAVIYGGSDAFNYLQYGWSALLLGGALTFTAEPIGGAQVTLTPTDGVWTHYAMIRSHLGSMFVFENGVLAGSFENTDLVSGAFRIAKSSTNFVNVELDEIALFDRALAVTEIGSLAQGKRVDSGLMAYYKFDTGTGSILFDSSFGVFEHFTPTINGTLQSINFRGGDNFTTGSLYFLASGTGELIYTRTSGLTNFTVYPVTYGVDRNHATGSPWTAVDYVLNSPIQIVGSDIGESTTISNINIKYQ